MQKIPTIKRARLDPQIPIDYADPTELGRIRAGAVRRVNERFDFILSQVRSYVRDEIKPTGSRQVNSQLRRYSSNAIISMDNHPLLVANETLFDYLFGDEEYQDFTDFLNGLLWATLLSNAFSLANYTRSTRVYIVQWEPNWWFNPYVSQSSERGIKNVITSARYQTTVGTTDRDIAAMVRDIDAESMISTPSYQSSLRTSQRAAFEDMRSLTQGLTGSLAETLRQAVRDGLSQSEIIKKVAKKLIDSDKKGEGGARKRARNLVRNRLNNARREQQRDHVSQLNRDVYADSEFEMRELWFSALMPGRTRRWHAERHGNTYTVEQNEVFYSDPGNRSNCYCNQTPILVYKETGEPVTDTGLLDRMQKQKAVFMQSR